MHSDRMSPSGWSPEWLRISEEVRDALAERRPVVALESTVLAQGLPRPTNLEVGRALEAIVREGGGVPATVAVLDGTARIGLTDPELVRVANEPAIEKRSTRDLALSLARRESGATTVAATAFLAARAGIEVFATGGIGGVHRGTPPDVSADLTELQRTSILVVCSGAKSILDLPATREMLETLGILVVGWRTDDLPAFYTPGSGLSVDARVDDARDLAGIWRARRALDGGAVLVCAPIPAGSALPREAIDEAIAAALRSAEVEGVKGKAITPYLLREVATATAGRSLDANIALLKNNAAIATSIAAEVTTTR